MIGRPTVFVAREREEVADVVRESQGREVARTLVAAPVVGDEVESIGASRESGEGAAAVEPAVNADDRGLGSLDATFGDRESGHR